MVSRWIYQLDQTLFALNLIEEACVLLNKFDHKLAGAMEHGLLAIALYKLANIWKLLSSCGFFRLESFQLAHYIRVWF